MSDKIVIRGAREHNLKNIDVEIPRNRLVVITGISGSGKSSLAFDTIYAEGQRRYVESLSAYARQFLGLMEKPDVDYIEGLSPAISIEQRTAGRNPRSTVGTATEIYDYLRLLFARLGVPHCYRCGRPISQQTPEQIVDSVKALPEGTRIQILAPVVRGRKGEHRDGFEKAKRDGYVRVRVDGEILSLDSEIKLDKMKKHSIEVVVDRLVIRPGIEARLADSVETALKEGDGIAVVDVIGGEEMLFSEKFACVECGISYEEIEPRLFSFNSPYGACPECDGLGNKMELDPDKIIPDRSLSINQGAIVPWGDPRGKWIYGKLSRLARYYGFSLDTPFEEIPEVAAEILLYGSGSDRVPPELSYPGEFEGVIEYLRRRYRRTDSMGVREWIRGFMSIKVCERCKGARLRPEALAVKFRGKSISEVAAMSVKEAKEFFDSLRLSEKEELIARQILKEIRERLRFLINVGLDYLTLDRLTGTLSGGEAQRIRLATQIGSQLVGVLYILDEPSIGLHQRDNRRLLDTLLKLRDLGNTVLVVEHDRATIETADHIIDLGPGAGIHGGEVVACGTLEEWGREGTT